MILKNAKVKLNRKDLKYETKELYLWFQRYNTTRSFGDNNYTVKISINEGETDQTNLLKNWKNLLKNLDQEQKKMEIKREILLKV